MAARTKTAKTKRSKRSKTAKAVGKAAATAAAKGAKRAVPGPKGKPNPALKKFSAAIRKDAALRAQLLKPMSSAQFHKTTVALGAERGLHFTVAESKWHVAESRRLAAFDKPPLPYKDRKAWNAAQGTKPVKFASGHRGPEPYSSWGRWDAANQNAPDRRTAPPVPA